MDAFNKDVFFMNKRKIKTKKGNTESNIGIVVIMLNIISYKIEI